MKTKMSMTIAVATLFVAGCAQWPRGADKVQPSAGDPRIKCEASHSVCHIAVRVRDCKVEVDPDWKRVAFRPEGVRMLWTLQDSKGVSFARNGILFERPDGQKGAVFTPDRREGWDTFAMRNSTAAGKYKYTVNVIDNGKRCEPHDPGVINEM